MSPSATNPELTQSGQYPNFYRTIAPDDAQARIEVDFALDTLKVKKIAVLHDKQDYGRGLAEFARKFIEASGGRLSAAIRERSTSTPGRRPKPCSMPSPKPAPRIRPRSPKRCTASSSRRRWEGSASMRAGMPRASASRCTVSKKASTSR
jgi:hypothetical protein